MTRFLYPTLAAWLALWVSLTYISNAGWHQYTVESSGDDYLPYAESLVSRYRYEDCTTTPCLKAYRLPGYPAFLASILLTSPDNLNVTARAIQAILMAGSVYLATALGYRLYPRARWLIILLMLGLRQGYYYVPILYTETLFTFILMIYAYAHLYKPRYAGLGWGVSLLIRSSLIFATPLLLLLQAPRRRLIFILSISMVCLPLWVRNSLVFNEVTFFSTNGGTVLKAGHNDASYQTGEHVAPPAQPDWQQYAGLGEVAQDRALSQDAIQYAAQHTNLMTLWRKIRISLGVEGLLWLLISGGLYGLRWRSLWGSRLTVWSFLDKRDSVRRLTPS